VSRSVTARGAVTWTPTHVPAPATGGTPSARTRDALGRTSTVTDTETATLEPALATAGLAGKVSHYFNTLNTWKVNCYFNKLNVLFKVNISVDQGFTCVRPLLHVRITLSNQLKIALQRNLWVYYMYAFPMR